MRKPSIQHLEYPETYCIPSVEIIHGIQWLINMSLFNTFVFEVIVVFPPLNSKLLHTILMNTSALLTLCVMIPYLYSLCNYLAEISAILNLIIMQMNKDVSEILWAHNNEPMQN